MKRIHLASLMLLAIAAFATATHGQSLTERANAVKAKKAREAEALLPKHELTPREVILQSLLYTNLSVSFDQTPAQDAFDYFKTALGIELIVHYSDDDSEKGIDPLTPITLKAEDMQALKLMKLLLGQCQGTQPYTWQLREAFLEIGTKAHLSDYYSREIRFYDIESLLSDPIYIMADPDYGIDKAYRKQPTKKSRSKRKLSRGNIRKVRSGKLKDKLDKATKQQRAQVIVNLIIETIETKGWEQNGGEWATINYKDGSIMVNAPDFIHRQINGYPSVPRPAKSKPTDKESSAKKTQDPSQEKKP